MARRPTQDGVLGFRLSAANGALCELASPGPDEGEVCSSGVPRASSFDRVLRQSMSSQTLPVIRPWLGGMHVTEGPIQPGRIRSTHKSPGRPRSSRDVAGSQGRARGRGRRRHRSAPSPIEAGSPWNAEGVDPSLSPAPELPPRSVTRESGPRSAASDSPASGGTPRNSLPILLPTSPGRAASPAGV